MGVRLIVDSRRDTDRVALFCSTSGWAFGPVFDSETEAEAFLDYCDLVVGADPRAIDEKPGRLERVYNEWRKAKQEQEDVPQQDCSDQAAETARPTRYRIFMHPASTVLISWWPVNGDGDNLNAMGDTTLARRPERDATWGPPDSLGTTTLDVCRRRALDYGCIREEAVT